MAGVNKVILVGNLGRDPESKVTQGGTTVTRLNLATSRAYTNKVNERVEETEWHRVSVWGKSAEACAKYLSKGSKVYLEGRLRTSEYTPEDGIKRYSTEIIANDVQFLDSKGGGKRDDGPGEAPGGGGQDFSSPSGDDDIPF
jgi:single-strand DNA-binding protein